MPTANNTCGHILLENVTLEYVFQVFIPQVSYNICTSIIAYTYVQHIKFQSHCYHLLNALITYCTYNVVISYRLEYVQL